MRRKGGQQTRQDGGGEKKQVSATWQGVLRWLSSPTLYYSRVLPGYQKKRNRAKVHREHQPQIFSPSQDCGVVLHGQEMWPSDHTILFTNGKLSWHCVRWVHKLRHPRVDENATNLKKTHTPPWCGENPVSRMLVKAQCPSLQQCLCRKLIQMGKLRRRGHVAAQAGERQEDNEQGLHLPGRGGFAPCGRHELHVCKEDGVPGWQPRIHGSRGWLYLATCDHALKLSMEKRKQAPTRC